MYIVTDPLALQYVLLYWDSQVQPRPVLDSRQFRRFINFHKQKTNASISSYNQKQKTTKMIFLTAQIDLVHKLKIEMQR